jgi:hypothetical protein
MELALVMDGRRGCSRGVLKKKQRRSPVCALPSLLPASRSLTCVCCLLSTISALCLSSLLHPLSSAPSAVCFPLSQVCAVYCLLFLPCASPLSSPLCSLPKSPYNGSAVVVVVTSRNSLNNGMVVIVTPTSIPFPVSFHSTYSVRFRTFNSAKIDTPQSPQTV